MHYKGQIFELTVSAPDGDLDADKISLLEEAFGQEHERTYGHRAGSDEPVELVNAQLIGLGVPDSYQNSGGSDVCARRECRCASIAPRILWRRTWVAGDKNFASSGSGVSDQRSLHRRRVRRDLSCPTECARASR